MYGECQILQLRAADVHCHVYTLHIPGHALGGTQSSPISTIPSGQKQPMTH